MSDRETLFQSRRPLLLDLFCGAGGAGEGYHRAGFDIVGVDISPQPNYPFQFEQIDALDALRGVLPKLADAIHASPPCQAYSDLQKQNKRIYPALIEPVRELLRATGLPYVIENVEGAPLVDPVLLCGTMFRGLRVQRHRLFETNWPLEQPYHKPRLLHPLVHTRDKRKRHYGLTDEMRDFVQVTGGGNCSKAAAADAMEIDWMTKVEMNEAIPPAYTEHIGSQLLAYLDARDDYQGYLRSAVA